MVDFITPIINGITTVRNLISQMADLNEASSTLLTLLTNDSLILTALQRDPDQARPLKPCIEDLGLAIAQAQDLTTRYQNLNPIRKALSKDKFARQITNLTIKIQGLNGVLSLGLTLLVLNRMPPALTPPADVNPRPQIDDLTQPRGLPPPRSDN